MTLDPPFQPMRFGVIAAARRGAPVRRRDPRFT